MKQWVFKDYFFEQFLREFSIRSCPKFLLVLIFLTLLSGCKSYDHSLDDYRTRALIDKNAILSFSQTIFKLNEPDDNGNRPDPADCMIVGQFQIDPEFSSKTNAFSHRKIKFTGGVPNCPDSNGNDRTEGWVFEGHIGDVNRIMTITRPTALLDDGKNAICQVEPSVVQMLSEHLEQGDYVKFRPEPEFIDTLPAGCKKRPTYWIAKSSFAAGVQAITLTGFAILKSDPVVNASRLLGQPIGQVKNQICHIPPGTYISTKPIKAVKGHYELNFASSINTVPLQGSYSDPTVMSNPDLAKKFPGARMACDFSKPNTAYVWHQQTQFQKPDAKAVSGGSGDYYYPIQGDDPGITSDWCRLRNIGTSPHIGTDFGSYQYIKSQAIYDGKIQRIGFIGSCGYEVWLEDDRGALWRYLHCDQPPRHIQAGARVKGGDILCTNSMYPAPGCGGARHLHLERHRKGNYPAKNAAHAGCNFDSQTPFLDRDKVLK